MPGLRLGRTNSYVPDTVFVRRTAPAKLRYFISPRRIANAITFAVLYGVTSFAPSLILPLVQTSLGAGGGVMAVTALGAAMFVNGVTDRIAARASTRGGIDFAMLSLSTLMKRMRKVKGDDPGFSESLLRAEERGLHIVRSHYSPIIQKAIVDPMRLLFIHGIRVAGIVPAALILGVASGGVGASGIFTLLGAASTPLLLAGGFVALRTHSESHLFDAEEEKQRDVNHIIDRLADERDRSVTIEEIDSAVEELRASTEAKLLPRITNGFAITAASAASLTLCGLAIATGMINVANPAALFSGLTVMVTGATQSFLALSPTIAQWREGVRNLRESPELRRVSRTLEFERVSKQVEANDRGTVVRMTGDFPDVTVPLNETPREITVDLSFPLDRAGPVVIIDEGVDGSRSSAAQALVAALGSGGEGDVLGGRVVVEDVTERELGPAALRGRIGWMPDTAHGLAADGSSLSRRDARKVGRFPTPGDVKSGRVRLLAVENMGPSSSPPGFAEESIPVVTSMRHGHKRTHGCGIFRLP